MARSPISSPFTGLWPHSHHCFLSSLNLSRLQCFFLLVAALPGAPPKIFPRLDAVCNLNLSSNATSSRKLSMTAAAAAKSLQSCPTLCDPMDGSPPGSPVPGILQARTLEWVAISFSNVTILYIYKYNHIIHMYSYNVSYIFMSIHLNFAYFFLVFKKVLLKKGRY